MCSDQNCERKTFKQCFYLKPLLYLSPPWVSRAFHRSYVQNGALVKKWQQNHSWYKGAQLPIFTLWGRKKSKWHFWWKALLEPSPPRVSRAIHSLFVKNGPLVFEKLKKYLWYTRSWSWLNTTIGENFLETPRSDMKSSFYNSPWQALSIHV